MNDHFSKLIRKIIPTVNFSTLVTIKFGCLGRDLNPTLNMDTGRNGVDRTVIVQLDTGARCNVMSQDTFRSVGIKTAHH